MIIDCPQCSAKFNLPDGALGTKGRKLKCAKCGHTWHQASLDTPVPSAAIPSAPVAPPPPRPPTRPRAKPIDLPLEMEPDGAPPKPRPSKQNVDAELEDLDNILGKMRGGGVILDEKPMPGATEAFEDDDEELRDFLRSRGLGGDDDDDSLDDLDDLMGDDADPIPGVFTGPRPRRQKRGGGVLNVLIVLLLALWAVALGLYFGRTILVEYVPSLAVLYEKLNIKVEGARKDLTFQNVVSTMETTGDGRVLIVRGLLTNATDENREVPDIRLVVVDGDDKELSQVVAPPPQAVLAPGDKVSFEVRMENPSQLAQNFLVNFVAKE
ncbi:MAG: zinc-ribbon domain-containing protein [Rhodospirillum sp.]|nr:zinc-ribbon domain-containing protein [Rhodospirillum sp.]MCF8491884.1 zinc-ribbon domain-containing protein [Rhodospirillum sp.]MCF8502268.1 zinc-ribbon domain-containing protein [Rhodospirillum sp.]